MNDLSDHPLGLLAEVTRREFIHILESMPGAKELVVGANLLRPIDRIASMSLLQEHGCRRVLPLRSDGALPPPEPSIRRVYLVRSSLAVARLISSHVRAAPPDRRMAVIWVERRLFICERELERQGVFGLIDSFELNISLIGLEDDLFSLELPISDRVDLYASAHAIFQLQSLYGIIPTIYGLGEQSEKMWKLFKILCAERGEPRASPDFPISHLFVFDRSLDHLSVLLTGLTYEAMLHDVFGISCGKISFGADVEERMKPEIAAGDASSAAPKRAKVYVLDNNDGVFASVRSKHMTGVFPFLRAKAKEIQTSYDKGAAIDQVRDMKQFVSSELKALKLQHRQLEMHICACEVLLERSESSGTNERLNFEHSLIAGNANLGDVMSFLEECMLREQSPWSVLALASIASLTNNGLPSKLFQNFREHFLRAYGYEYLPVIHSLITRRLLVEKPKVVAALSNAIPNTTANATAGLGTAGTSSGVASSGPTMPFLIKRLNLVSSSNETSIDLRNPSQMSYVFSGAFTPPACQIVSDAMVHGWNTNEMKKTFAGKVFVETNSYAPAERKPDSRMRKAILVFFLGGVTYAEIAALRLLAIQNNFRILIATTNILQKEAFVKRMGDVDTNSAPRVYTKFGTKLHDRVDKHLKFTKEIYYPTWWCPFGCLMTIARQAFRTRLSLPFEREVVTLSDGGEVGIDWMHSEKTTDHAPIVVFLPGITGSTHDCSYILHPVVEVVERGWRAVVVNCRGLGGVKLRTNRAYNAANPHDIKEVIAHISERYPQSKKIGCGFSMGGMILWNYLAHMTNDAVNLDGALVISSPFDPFAATESIERFPYRILFNGFLAKGLVRIVEPYRDMFEADCDFKKVLEARTIRDFDTHFVAPTFGYKSLMHYYEDAALHPKVAKIPIPTVCLNAVDDVFAPIESIPINDVCSKTDNVVNVITTHGGHTAFMEGWNPNGRGIAEKLIEEFGSMIFEEKM